MRKIVIILFLVISIVISGFSQEDSIKPTNKKGTDSLNSHAIKYGNASYYAKKFEGRQTASGHIYHANLLTAACNVLPLGTWVRVTNLRNKKIVVVLINDRLHRRSKRLIDLTYTAAKQLGFAGRGITRVKVEVLDKLPKRKMPSGRIHRRKRHPKKKK